MQRLGHGHRRGEILFAHHHCGRYLDSRQQIAQIGVAQHLAGSAVAIHIIGNKDVHQPGHGLRVGLTEGITKPARALEFRHRGQSLFTRGGSAFTPLLGRFRAIAGGSVNETELFQPCGVATGKGQCNATAHGASRHRGALPADVRHQLGQIARKQLRRIRAGHTVGGRVTATIPSQHVYLVRQALHHAVPDRAAQGE